MEHEGFVVVQNSFGFESDVPTMIDVDPLEERVEDQIEVGMSVPGWMLAGGCLGLIFFLAFSTSAVAAITTYSGIHYALVVPGFLSCCYRVY